MEYDRIKIIKEKIKYDKIIEVFGVCLCLDKN